MWGRSLLGGLPKGVDADEAVRAFEKAGGVSRPGKGSHINIKMPNGQIVTIPRHGPVKVGLLHAAIRKADLSVEDFVRLLGR
jgi:predicted RNA binding protein YcfA (HicA-like mRNA interferase family)